MPTRSSSSPAPRPSASPRRCAFSPGISTTPRWARRPRPASSSWPRSRRPQERWLSGHEAYSVLRRVEARTADPVERARIGELIQARLRQGGFAPLFDGRGFDGWKGLVADPPARAKMTPAGAGRRRRPRPTTGCGPTGRSSTASSSSTARARASAPPPTTATSSSSSIGRSRRAATAASTSAARPRSRSGTPTPTLSARAASTTTRRGRASPRRRPTAPSGSGTPSASS